MPVNLVLSNQFYDIFREDELLSIVDFFFNYDIHLSINDYRLENTPRFLGLCSLRSRDPLSIDISLSIKNINACVKSGKACGGDFYSDNLKCAMACTLVHELRHAQQFIKIKSESIYFRSKNYRTRPCEVDARNYVNKNFNIIKEMVSSEDEFDINMEFDDDKNYPDNWDLINVISQSIFNTFDSQHTLNSDDFTDELKENVTSLLKKHNINNAINFSKVLEIINKKIS